MSLSLCYVACIIICEFDAMWFIMTYTYTQEHTYLGYKESPYTATVVTYISSP